MTGLESIAVAAAPKLAGGLASTILSKLLPKLAKSPLQRWRIWRDVRVRTKTKLAYVPYTRWLKKVLLTDLHIPIEQNVAPLVDSLLAQLDNTKDWRSLASQKSEALRVVEETYRAVLRFVEESETRVLEQSWSHYRHLSLLQSIAGETGRVGLSSFDLGTLLLEESETRQLRRLASFRLDAEITQHLIEATNLNLPIIDEGTARVLIGAFGSGKSEQAEKWFATIASKLKSGKTDTYPLWFHSSELVHTSLQDAIRTRGAEGRVSSGLAIVIDGLDEIDAASAIRVADNTRVFIAGAAACSALLTSRPGVLNADESDIPCPLLTEGQSQAIIDRVSGSSTQTWSWNEELHDAIRRPFFAITVGLSIRNGKSVSGQASLIRNAVELALKSPGSSSAALESVDIYNDLVLLASRLTNTGNSKDGLNLSQRSRALKSRLTHEIDGRAEFVLPIFQQWFAAQTIRGDHSIVSVACSSPLSFDRWRWAIVVAIIASETQELDQILASAIRSNAGAGAWLLAESSSALKSREGENDPPLDPQLDGERLVTVARAWSDGLGPSSALALPRKNQDEAIVIGLGIRDRTISLTWSTETRGHDRVLPLPSSQVFDSPDSPWDSWRHSFHVMSPTWPWEHFRGVTEKRFKKHLEEGVLGTSDGVWRLERRQQLLRAFAQSNNYRMEPIDRGPTLERLGGLLDRIGEDCKNARIQLSHKLTVECSELIDLNTWLENQESDLVEHHLPSPDVFPPPNGWRWEVYSKERLVSAVRETLGLACEAYDEAVKTNFSSFDWSLGSGEAGDFGTLTHIDFRPDGEESWLGPSVTTIKAPLDFIHDEAQKSDIPFTLSDNKRAAVAYTVTDPSERTTYLHKRTEELWHSSEPLDSRTNPFRGMSISTSGPKHIQSRRPASATAAEWIWSDLHRIRLVSLGPLSLN